MRGGVREQNKLIQAVRKALRKDSGMADVTGFSLLSVAPIRTGVKRTRQQMTDDTVSMNDALYSKKTRFF